MRRTGSRHGTGIQIRLVGLAWPHGKAVPVPAELGEVRFVPRILEHQALLFLTCRNVYSRNQIARRAPEQHISERNRRIGPRSPDRCACQLPTSPSCDGVTSTRVQRRARIGWRLAKATPV